MVVTKASRTLAVILHADVAGSTQLVQRDVTLAHERITSTFRRLSSTIRQYQERGLSLTLQHILH